MHTPRLCFDTRASVQYAKDGILADELIDQLMATIGDNELGTEWFERSRVVALSHRSQLLPGQLKRFDTRIPLGGTLLHQAWEKKFVSTACLSALCQWKPIDKFTQTSCQTITGLLPPMKRLPFHIPAQDHDRFIVPSKKDALLLQHQFGIASSLITVVVPSIRRYVKLTEPIGPAKEGWILIVTDGSYPLSHHRRGLSLILQERFPNVVQKVVHVKNSAQFAPGAWKSLLQKSSLFFYLVEKPFDSPVIALEALYWKIPTVYLDVNHALGELLVSGELKLSRFLIESFSQQALRSHTALAHDLLRTQGVFDEKFLARQFQSVLSGIIPAVESNA